MAIDPRPPARPVDARPEAGPRLDPDAVSTYRAISPLAILSVVAGLASILTFTSAYFAIFGVLAIALANLARRSIRKFSDVLTGERLANVGIGLGLLFSLSALTLGVVQDRIVQHEASKFARVYEEVLQKGSTADALFYKLPPAARKGKNPKEAIDEMTASMKNSMEREQHQKAVLDLKARLNASDNQAIVYDSLAQHSTDGLAIHAFARYKIHGPATPSFPNATQYALVKFRGDPVDGAYGWFVEDVTFPYPYPSPTP